VAVDKAKILHRIIEKIPMFNNLGVENAKAILQLCELRAVQAWDTLCRNNEQSNDMLILLSGQLGIFTGDNRQVATVEPVALVGEIGLITGQPRPHTVRAMQQSSLLVLGKAAFDRVMRTQGEICLRIYSNVGRTLVERLGESAAQRAAAAGELEEMQARLRKIQEEIAALRAGQAAP